MSQAGKIALNLMEVIAKKIPKEGGITRVEYEGPRIALYTKNPRFLIGNNPLISDIVNSVKKRVVIRCDISLRKSEEETRQYIGDIASSESGLSGIFFDNAIGEVIVDVNKPSLLKQQSEFNLLDFAEKTGWIININKISTIPSTTLKTIYQTLKSTETEREKLFRNFGNNIFRSRLTSTNEVTLKTLGGFQEVGRSSMLIETGESKILLDCGIHPGAKNSFSSYPRFDWAGIDLQDLDAVIMSHAHLDHSGFLPALFKYGYNGPVYCSEPTLPLMTLLLNDAVKIASMEGRQFYDLVDVRDMIKHCVPLSFGSVTDVSPDIKIVLKNSGHILGSASIHLHIGDGSHNIVYSGDFKYGPSSLLEPAILNYPRVETLIVEGTYGSKIDIMPSREEVDTDFVHSINDTIKSDGKVLIPVPAVGRAQEIMLVLSRYMNSGDLIECPIFIEGMISEATAIHINYPEYLERNLRKQIIENDESPFESDYFTIVNHPSQRSEVLQTNPCIIMATSGMLEGGPVLDYFGKISNKKENKIIFVSYQVQGTLGRRVLDGTSDVSLVNEDGKIQVVSIKCDVEKIDGFSGHSDYNQIMKYVSRLRPKLKRVIVDHGEKRKLENLSHIINRIFKIPASAPAVREAIKIC